MPSIHLTADQLDRLGRVPDSEIAAEVGCSRGTIYRLRRRQAVKPQIAPVQCPCGQTFSPVRRGQVYCSKPCCKAYSRKVDSISLGILAAANPPSESVTCRGCGNSFSRPVNPIGREYCSTRCYNTHWARERRKKRPPRNCDQCGAQFHPAHSDSRYCSSRCSRLAYTARVKSEKAATLRPCDQCQTLYHPTNRSHRYCSHRCAQQRRRNSRRPPPTP